MTARDRVLRLLDGEAPDRVPWFGDLDYWAAGLMARNEELGVHLLPSRIEALQGGERRGALKTLTGPDGAWRARLVIVATGARLRMLGVPGEQQFAGLPAHALLGRVDDFADPPSARRNGERVGDAQGLGEDDDDLVAGDVGLRADFAIDAQPERR